MELVIKDLYVSVEGKEILKGVNLEVHDGEVHALMGPNGNGKSTLLSTIMGNPLYKVDKGDILFNGESIIDMPVDERSKKGLFLAMQYPPAIPGVTNSEFLKAAINARRETPISLFEFIKSMDKSIKSLNFDDSLAHRVLNEGFSGGEKKRNEILQMMLLKPELAMLDEIDSGLDVDAIKIVGDNLNQMLKDNPKLSLIVVSHYERFLELVVPTHVHVLIDGRIVVEGGAELTNKIDNEGYKWIEKDYNVKIQNNIINKPSTIGVCAVKKTEDN